VISLSQRPLPTKRKTNTIKTSAEFEPAFPAIEWLQAYTLHGLAIAIRPSILPLLLSPSAAVKWKKTEWVTGGG